MQNVTLQGSTIGIVGTGNVGREVARIANALGMKCLAWTYNPSPERAQELGVEFVELDDLLKESDVVSLHVRLSSDSRHIIGARELALMKPGALLINGDAASWWTTSPSSKPSNRDTSPAPASTSSLRSRSPSTIPSSPAIRSSSHPTSPTRPLRASSLLNEGAVTNVIAFLEGRPNNVVT